MGREKLNESDGTLDCRGYYCTIKVDEIELIHVKWSDYMRSHPTNLGNELEVVHW